MSDAGLWTDSALREETLSRWWRVAWHGFFYLLLVVATAASLAGDPATAAARTLRLAPAVVLGAWHGVWQVGPLRVSGHAVRVYLLGATVLWAVLTVVDPEFLILGLAVFAPFCLQHLGVAVALAAVVVGGVVWQ